MSVDYHKQLYAICQAYLQKYAVNYLPCLTIKSQHIGVIGDIHGDFITLQKAIDATAKCEYVIFLGDYIDRGIQSYECLCRILELALKSDKYIILSGNHEDPLFMSDFVKCLLPKEQSLVKQVFQILPIGCMVKVLDKQIFLAHGGLPRYYDNSSNIHTLQSLYDKQIFHTNIKTPMNEISNKEYHRHDSFTENRSIPNFINTAYRNWHMATEQYNDAVAEYYKIKDIYTHSVDDYELCYQKLKGYPISLADNYTDPFMIHMCDECLKYYYSSYDYHDCQKFIKSFAQQIIDMPELPQKFVNNFLSAMLSDTPERINAKETVDKHRELIGSAILPVIEEAYVNYKYMAKRESEALSIWNNIKMYTLWSDIHIPDTIFSKETRGIYKDNDSYDMFERQFRHSGINCFIRGHQVTPDLFSCYDMDGQQCYDMDVRNISYSKDSHIYITLHTTTCYSEITEAFPKLLIITADNINVVSVR